MGPPTPQMFPWRLYRNSPMPNFPRGKVTSFCRFSTQLCPIFPSDRPPASHPQQFLNIHPMKRGREDHDPAPPETEDDLLCHEEAGEEALRSPPKLRPRTDVVGSSPTQPKHSRYDAVKAIGSGTYAQVFEARDNQQNRRVALKKQGINAEKSNANYDQVSDFTANAVREANALNDLKHKNIVPLLDLFIDGYNTVMVLPYAPTDLYQYLAELRSCKKTMPTETVRHIMYQLVSAMHHAHDKGYIHRDLKTSNLLLYPENDYHLYVADWGLSRVDMRGGAPLTEEVVTRWYRAPELLLNMMRYSVPIDMWSVGCIMGELFLGVPIFQGGSEMEMLTEIFKVCGRPTVKSWPELQTNRSYNSTVQFMPESKPTRPAQFHRMDDPAWDLFTRLLTLRPEDRITAAQALQHPYFEQKE